LPPGFGGVMATGAVTGFPVLSLIRTAYRHGVWAGSGTAIGRLLVLLAALSSCTRACALMVGVKPSSGKKSPRLACVARTSTIGPVLPFSSVELQMAVLFAR